MNVDSQGRGAMGKELSSMKRLPWRWDIGVVGREPGGGAASPPLRSPLPSPSPSPPAPFSALMRPSSSTPIDPCTSISENLGRQHKHRFRRLPSFEARSSSSSSSSSSSVTVAVSAARDRSWLSSWAVSLAVLWVLVLQAQVGSVVGTSCDPAMDEGCISFAVYRMKRDESLLEVAERFRENVTGVLLVNGLNEMSTTTENDKVFIPLRCSCVPEQRIFRAMPTYAIVRGDTLSVIAAQKYQYMTTIQDIAGASGVENVDYILAGATLTIPIPCACNRSSVPPFAYQSFLTYVPRQADNGILIATEFNSSTEAMRAGNDAAQEVNVQANKPIIIPSNKTFPSLTIKPLPPAEPNCSIPGVCPEAQPPQQNTLTEKQDSGKGFPSAIFISLIVGGVIIFIIAGLLIAFILTKVSKRRHGRRGVQQGSSITRHFFSRSSAGTENTTGSSTAATDVQGQCGASNMAGFEEPDRMIAFTYNELANATDNFSIANKIGQGAFGTVYYAKLRNREAAIKKMNLVKSQEFRQELKILNRVHHKHLVELIGFCKENFLFLVYEYCEQGTLASHLHSPAAYGALTWITRIQAASDAAQALEYIHEHTRPTYVHRDIKSNNILLDKNLRAKVADFGLIKLIGQDDGNGPLTTKLVGTFGYMAPEYVKFGDLSPKSDVFSFGVVLLELLTGQQALSMMSTQSFPTSGSSFEHRKALTDSVVPLIKEMKSDKEVAAIVDPQLHDNYAVSAALKLAQLAAQCTSDSPHERPDMKRIVYILDEIMKLSQHGPEASEAFDMGCILDSLAR